LKSESNTCSFAYLKKVTLDKSDSLRIFSIKHTTNFAFETIIRKVFHEVPVEATEIFLSGQNQENEPFEPCPAAPAHPCLRVVCGDKPSKSIGQSIIVSKMLSPTCRINNMVVSFARLIFHLCESPVRLLLFYVF